MTDEHIGRYQIKGELGRGGMATVFHAYDPNFERDVAIKILPGAFLHDPQLRLRFEREAKIIASLEHSAIVPVYDFGEQDGQPYIVMRYMSGGSLSDRIHRGPLSLEVTAQIINRLAPALDAAHARGIIHRDIKPGNVLFDQYENAFLSDFGIARHTQSVSTTLTGESIVGTPAYMSPEQIQGDKTIDGRSDIYAMGVLVYQMLTGQIPYQSDTPAKVMLMHILEPIPLITAKKADLPPGCQDVIIHAMAKDPATRYTSSAELSSALDSILDTHQGKPTTQEVEDLTLISGVTVIGKSISSPRSAATINSSTPIRTVAPVAQHGIEIPAPSVAPKIKYKSVLLALLFTLIVGIAGVTAYAFLGKRADNRGMVPAATATEMILAMGTATIGATVAQPPASPTLSPTILPSDTGQPSATPTLTVEPTATQTPKPAGIILGGADKIAFINNRDIWVANLDGTELRQITTDQTIKFSLNWMPDGDAIIFISGYCIQIARIESQTVENITCLKYIDTLKSFDISPDGQKVAIVIDNQMYIVPFSLDQLRQVETRNDVASLATCADFAPYKKNFLTQVRWSSDSTTVAAKLIANLGNGRQGDLISIFRIDSCIPNPKAIDNFPGPRFTLKTYEKNPIIPNFSWDGLFLFALHTVVRNDGFGDLTFYNTDLKKANLDINPIDQHCCYRDPQWSPDGNYLLFAFQDATLGANSTTRFYYIPYGVIGSGASFEPIPLPEIVDPKEKPYPILRDSQ